MSSRDLGAPPHGRIDRDRARAGDDPSARARLLEGRNLKTPLAVLVHTALAALCILLSA